ncbi:MAG: hypothetical protein K2P81_05830 [Bacteriovoracaceae bacterium]|nr:hypothetical protein [Bacteriovoracaceae bacterium]
MRELVLSSSDRLENSLVGGKARQLIELKRAQCRVPDFIIIPTTTVELLKSKEIEISKVMNELSTLTQNWNGSWFAIRSSVTAEDGMDTSFAGLFETYLYVKPDQIQEKMHLAIEAMTSPRVMTYCQEKKVTSELKMALVIQKMLDPLCAGVSFSRSPLAPTADILIDSSWGVGEGVVSGVVETDHWRVSRLREILYRKINEKKNKLGLDRELGGTRGFEVEPHLIHSPSLTDDQIFEIYSMVLRLEEHFAHPVDIEWAYEDGKLYLLQARPITQDFPSLKVYTDTNLAESYPGVVSPFTASFVKVAYRNVFAESAILLGASEARMQVLMPHYQSLIGEVDHHLYYDLEHYYSVLSALPGGEKNIENWHRMIGGKKEGMQVPMHLIPLKPFEQIKAVLKLLLIILNQNRILGRFCESLELQKEILKKEISQCQDSKIAFSLLHRAVTKPIGFGLTVINDVILMIGIKALTQVLKSEGISEEALAPMLKTDSNVESLKPLQLLDLILSKMPATFWIDWEKLIQTLPDEEKSYSLIWSELQNTGWRQECSELSQFLALYGDRAFEELKIESPTLRQSPKAFNLLLSFMKSASIQTNTRKTSSTIDPNSFRLINKFLWKLCWPFTSRSIFWRERTRLLRGQFYNVIREMMEKGANLLKEEFPAFQECHREDFFSIGLDEYKQYSQGQLSEARLKEIIVSNNSWLHTKKNFEEFLVVAQGESPFVTEEKILDHTDLSGQVASEGTVTGIPLVLDNPIEAMTIENLNQYILVTRHTDPAWVYIMSRCKGLVSEKGSLLSHTAIIGRELGIPTIVGVKGAVDRLRAVSEITMDGKTGKVVIHGD